MLQKPAAFILLMAFAAISFQNLGLVASYRINNASFLKNCVNKNRPQLRCNGKCQLMKKMMEREHQEQEHPDSKPGSQNILFFTVNIPGQINHPVTGTHSTYLPYNAPQLTDRTADIFHPPRS
jgi:hypothetical protein